MSQCESAVYLAKGNGSRPRSDAPWRALTLPRVHPGDPSARAILAALEAAASRIQATEAEARRGDIEGIHRLRTATRRLRSELRAFRSLIDPRWVEPVESELRWLAGLLGAVRDVDILTERLRAAISAEGNRDGRALAPLFAHLMARHAEALIALRNALKGDRYRRLLTSLEPSLAELALRDEARRPCRDVLPSLAAAAWRRLKKTAKGLRPGDPDEDFHEVRKRAKFARYTAELIAPALGRATARAARRFIRRATRVQDVLGEHQDAIVAGRELARALVEHAHEQAFAQAALPLLDGQRQAAQEARSRFFEVWSKLDRRKCRRWIKTVSSSG